MILIVKLFAAFFGMFAIIFGAFGAHKLKKIMSSDLLQSFETGVKYQMYHALTLLVLSFHLTFTTTIEYWVAICMILGTVLFSFSIYGLTISAAKGKKMKILGPITPIGGLFLVTGWGVLFYYFLQTST